MKQPLYLDYAASTPVDPKVADIMRAHMTLDGVFANPASRSHLYGWQAEEAVENARSQLAELLGCDTREIVWTSGATESNNLAIKGIAFESLRSEQNTRPSDFHLITSKVEHKAVLDTFAFLENLGFDVEYLDPMPTGEITAEQLTRAIKNNTILVSLMHVNNEIGTINDIASLAKVCKSHEVLFHVDAAQSVGKLPLSLSDLPVDLLSISAHKMYGPKGMGALYVKRRPNLTLEPLIHGGGHERGMRSGTLATHQIAGIGEAAALCKQNMEHEFARLTELKMHFLEKLQALKGVYVNGQGNNGYPGIVNVSFDDVEGETLLIALRKLAVSTGSACVSTSVEPSYVLRALGVSDVLAHASIRFSFGRFTTKDDVEFAAQTVLEVVEKLRH